MEDLISAVAEGIALRGHDGVNRKHVQKTLSMGLKEWRALEDLLIKRGLIQRKGNKLYGPAVQLEDAA